MNLFKIHIVPTYIEIVKFSEILEKREINEKK